MPGFDAGAMLQVLGQGAINLPPQIAAQKRQKEQDTLQQELIRLQMQRQQEDLEWNDPVARAGRESAERARERFNALTDHERSLERIEANRSANTSSRTSPDPNLARQRAQTVQQREAQTAVQSILRPGQAEYIAFTSPNPENAVNLMVQNAQRVAPDIPEPVLRAEVNRAIEEVRRRGRTQGRSPGAGGGTSITKNADGSVTVNR